MRSRPSPVQMMMNVFLDDDLWLLSWNASVQRVRVYADGAPAREKTELSIGLHELAAGLVRNQYGRAVSEDQHCENIESLIKHANDRVGFILLERGYPYASAQKVLNLYLKYQWCPGRCAEPPHCPVDRIVLNMTHLREKANWTRITTREEYLYLIGAIRQEAQRENLTVSEWEMTHYRRRQSANPNSKLAAERALNCPGSVRRGRGHSACGNRGHGTGPSHQGGDRAVESCEGGVK
jgi:hypothetical protein